MNQRSGMFKSAKFQEGLGLFLLLALDLWLRVCNLHKPLWLDELGHLEAATAPTLSEVFSQIGQHAAAAPLDYLVLRAYLLFTNSTASQDIRLLYVLYSMLTIGLVYHLAKTLYDKPTALLSCWFLATSTFHIHYSQEIRFYALSTLIAVLSHILFLRAGQRQTGRDWLIWGLVCLLGLYTHYFLAFLFGLQVIFELMKRPARKSEKYWPMFAFSAAVLLFLPWHLWGAENASVSKHFELGIPIGNVLLTWTLAMGPALLLIPLLGFFHTLRDTKSQHLLALGILPLFGAFLVDNWAGYFFNPRQVIFSLPFVLILAAASLATAARQALANTPAHEQTKIQRLLGFVIVAILLGIFLVGVRTNIL